jgi:hypothetical protein
MTSCGCEVQIAPYQLIGQHGIRKHTKVWSLRERFLRSAGADRRCTSGKWQD